MSEKTALVHTVQQILHYCTKDGSRAPILVYMKLKVRRNSLAGDLGSLAQPVAMERLLASVAPPNQCFWYAHPWVEDAGGGGRTAQFSNGNLSQFVPVPAEFLGEVRRKKRFPLHSHVMRRTFSFCPITRVHGAFPVPSRLGVEGDVHNNPWRRFCFSRRKSLAARGEIDTPHSYSSPPCLPPTPVLRQVNRFKAVVVGGEGFSNAKRFAVGQFTLPIIALGVQTRWVVLQTRSWRSCTQLKHFGTRLSTRF